MWKTTNLLYYQIGWLFMSGSGIWPELLTLKRDVPTEKC